MASQAIFRNGRSFPFDFWHCRKGDPPLASSCVGIFRYDRLLQHQVLKGGKRSPLFSRHKVSHNVPFISSPTIKTYPIYDFLSMRFAPGWRPNCALLGCGWIAFCCPPVCARAGKIGGGKPADRNAVVREEELFLQLPFCPCRFPPPHPRHSKWGWPLGPTHSHESRYLDVRLESMGCARLSTEPRPYPVILNPVLWGEESAFALPAFAFLRACPNQKCRSFAPIKGIAAQDDEVCKWLWQVCKWFCQVC